MTESVNQPADAELWDQQIYRYAEELQELYQLEQKERQALAEEKLVLQFRLRELSSLNELFKRQLEQTEEMTNLLNDMESGLQSALGSATLEEARERLKVLLESLKGYLGK